MKVLIYSGSPNKKDSYCEYVAERLKEELYSPSIQISYLNAIDLDINSCRGCTECFKGRKCSLDDDIEVIKQSISESDLIVMISPVYVHHIPGSMKTMIDRLAYLAHLMPFIGKAGVVISVSSTNGNEFVTAYLEKVMEYWGMTIIEKLDIMHDTMDFDVVESYIIDLSDRIKYFKRHKELIANDRQKYIFDMYSQRYRTEDSPEAKKWNEQGYNKYESIQDVIDLRKQ